MDVLNALSFDVEDWYQVVAGWMAGRDVNPSDAVRRNVDHILEILETANTRATFFIVGKLAETHPGMVRKIHSQGHEIGSHTYSHTSLLGLSYKQVKDDIYKSIVVLEDITGEKVRGFRAPAFSITKKNPWALDILSELGFLYDSSIFPIRHPYYGWEGSPRFIYKINPESGGTLYEFPLTTHILGGRPLPFCGGGYLRLLPYVLTKRWLRKINGRNRPFVIYMHPYEFFNEETHIDFHRAKSRMKFRFFRCTQNLNRKNSADKLKKIVSEFQCTTMEEVIRGEK